MNRFLLVILILLLCGCSYGKIARKNNTAMLSLSTGETTDQVLKAMGAPSSTEKYTCDNKEVDIWFYQTSSFLTGGWDSDEYFTPIVFENKKLVGWGNDFCDREKLGLDSASNNQ